MAKPHTSNCGLAWFQVAVVAEVRQPDLVAAWKVETELTRAQADAGRGVKELPGVALLDSMLDPVGRNHDLQSARLFVLALELDSGFFGGLSGTHLVVVEVVFIHPEQ